ncbi:MAG: hypothetical protein ACR2L2_06330 [Acidobacteriota bacterium]
MSYKCPLCLKTLTDSDELQRYCTSHLDKTATIQCLPENFVFFESELSSTIFCPISRCPANAQIEFGVFLRHVGCKSENPFWVEADSVVKVPGNPQGIVVPYELDLGGEKKKTVNVQHWEIGMLRRVPSTREMWFPLLLLRATAEEHKGKRFGQLVELAGSKGVGKTVLALQAMDLQGYEGKSRRTVTVNDYIYSRRPEGAQDNPLLSILYLRGLMRRNESGIFPPTGTRRLPGDLKAVFFSPPSSNPKETTEPTGRKPGGVLARIRAEIDQIREPTNSSAGDSFRYTVGFYDTAGEAHEEEDLMPDLAAVDKIAILISAPEILSNSGKGQSVSTALQRLKRADEQNVLNRCCLVLTQFDQAMESLDEGSRTTVGEIAEDLKRAMPDSSAEAKSFLQQWLKKHPAPNHRELEAHLQRIDHVFFLWTEDLPTSTAQPTGQIRQPRSFGLARFICWCLEIGWEEIGHSRTS